MKKLLLAVCIAASIPTFAQRTYVQGGVNLANITKTNSGETEDNNLLPSFNVGIMHRFGLSPVLDLESGLLFTGHGSKADTYFNNGNDYVKTRFHPLYFEVPLNILLKFPLAPSTNIFVNAGPYAAIGVAGKSKRESRILGITSSSESNIKFSNDDPFTSEQDDAAYDKLKRFDFGLNFGTGVSFRQVILKVNYGLGLTKINSTESNNNANDKNKYRTLSFSVGFPIGK